MDINLVNYPECITNCQLNHWFSQIPFVFANLLMRRDDFRESLTALNGGVVKLLILIKCPVWKRQQFNQIVRQGQPWFNNNYADDDGII